MAEEQIGKYTIIEKRGEGGFGVLYKALDPMIDRIVALKVLHAQYASDERLSAWFRREAKAMARLSHPNIVTIHNFEIAGDRHFIVMEYVDGGDLDEEIKRTGKLSIDSIVSYSLQMTSAFGYAHDNGVVHRDIKPSNIMIDKNGRVKITDFGIAKILGDSKLTKTGSGVGSLHYMSPEQIEGKPVDLRSDIYSLGITIYQMITGKVPFTDDSDFVIMRAHLDQPPVDPMELRSDVPEELSRIVLKMLAKRPEDRHASMAEVAADLRKLEKREEIVRDVPSEHHIKTKTSVTPVDRMPSMDSLRESEPRRRTTPHLMAAAAVAVLIAVGGYFLFRGSGEQTASRHEQVENAGAMVTDTGVTPTEPQPRDSIPVAAESTTVISVNKVDSAQQHAEPVDTKQTPHRAEQEQGLGKFVVEVSPYDYRNSPKVVIDGKRYEMKDTPFEIGGIKPGLRRVAVHFNGESFFDEVTFADDVQRRSYRFNGPTGRVSISANIVGTDKWPSARVIVDDRELEGGTPLRVDLVEGPHRIAVKRPGFRTLDSPRIVRVKAGEDTSVTFLLKPTG